MLKLIRNSKSSKTNKSSKYRGVKLNKGKYEAYIILSKYDIKGNRKQIHFFIGRFETEKEAVNARVKYILDIL